MPAASKQVGPEFGSTELGAMEAFLSQGEAPVFLGLLLILGFRGLVLGPLNPNYERDAGEAGS